MGDSDRSTPQLSGLITDRSAEISPCGRYRYRLSRIWAAGPALTFLMLNPSTADATSDDPTIRRCMGFARRWGYGGLVVVNLYAFRATKPVELWRTKDPVGAANDDHLRAAFRDSTLIIAAWGSHARSFRVQQVMAFAPALNALGVTRSGQPRHPLYLPARAAPSQWP